MLYRSTRNKLDTYTSYKALRLQDEKNNGFILPLRIPVLECSQIESMRAGSILDSIADILNLFFGTEFTAWDMESTIGKSPVQLAECGQKVILAQYWKNPASKMEYYQQAIMSKLCSEPAMKPTVWVKVAVRIAFVAATILSIAENPVDVAVNTGDFEQMLAVYYCREMGVPIRKILIACNENSNIWDFVCRGTLHCGATLQKTNYPDQDKVIPELFEAYLFMAYGYEEVKRYLECLSAKQDYQLPEEADIPVNNNLFVSVIGQERIPAVISSFQSNNGITVNPYAAFSIGVLQDYRAKAGESSPTIVFEEAAP